MAANYHLANIRALLTAGFTPDELRRFCYDTPEFRAVYDQLAPETGKAKIIDLLLEHAERKGQLNTLLAWAKTESPAQYAAHEPYFFPSSTDRRPPTTNRRAETSPPSSLPALHSPASSPPQPLQPSNLPTSNPSPRPLRVFLCHASTDKPAVRDLYQRLSQEGFIQPWLDEEDLVPGQDWQLEIPKAVRTSDVVLVCLSPQSITKAGYVQKEIKFALDVADEQPEGTIFLIPIRLEACDVPERLQRWHWANLFEARGYERLLRALKRRAEAVSSVIPSASEESSPPAAQKSAEVITPPPPPEEPPARRETPHFVRSDMSDPAPIPPDLVTIMYPIHLELVRVPAGEFFMGSDPAKDKDAQQDEQPQHRVYVSEFFMGKYPVTNEQYAVFVKTTKYQVPGHWEKGKIPAGKGDHPVVRVSWDDAVAFCEWLSRESGRVFRLPTEAEWEKAARGTDGRIYPWGNQWDKTKLNSKEGGAGDTTPVGRYSPDGDSPYGAADMAGNVWEWCADRYDKKAYEQRVKTVVKDPTGPSKGDYRVLRGGAFLNGASWARCAARFGDYRLYWFRDLGLRVVGGGPFPSDL